MSTGKQHGNSFAANNLNICCKTDIGCKHISDAYKERSTIVKLLQSYALKLIRFPHKIFFLESQYKSTLENKIEKKETDLTTSITIMK